ncbi:helix-turn-helix domain-containing protein [Sediminibacillus dalangtanensis]|uniref:Helix-turn-helix domain-containing protein n=1 Tax=Sediminibacillus dalangtanensis TaxID=2729421 RepID=A0ABX7VS23_9BACI|nr:helix-turn-helix transcriptional regulator [Sediminibacillus dalangtanensis]QTM99739.1 helix-turn-helix domain-containing protein [Sediminibacillus dalangtanensis]
MIYQDENGLLLLRSDKLGERDWRSDHTYKLIFGSKGGGMYQTRHQYLTIGQRQFVIFNPLQEHRQLHMSGEKFLIELDQKLLKDASVGLGVTGREMEFAAVSYYHPQIDRWACFIRELIGWNSEKPAEANQLLVENSFTQLAILMVQYGLGKHQGTMPEVVQDEVLKLVTDAIKQSYEQDWTLDGMAEVARINKYQFAHLFKERTGISPYSWLQLYRLIRSQPDLIYTDETVLQIAMAHGFKNVSAYTRLFKKVYGATPSEFRTTNRFN